MKLNENSSRNFASVNSFIVLTMIRPGNNSPPRNIEVTWPQGRNGKTKADTEVNRKLIQKKKVYRNQGMEREVDGKSKKASRELWGMKLS